VRASDNARHRSVGRLQRAYVEGALSTATLETRTTRAYGSRTRSELAEVIRDLPSRRRLLIEKAAEWRDALTRRDHGPPAQVLRLSGADSRIVVGRSRSCDFIVSDPCVSARHCELVWTQDRWEVRDMNSTNGTYLGDRRTGVAEVHDADVLTVGQTEIVVSAR
jgi:FHA domain/Domain of unknown function (DUF1707)